MAVVEEECNIDPCISMAMTACCQGFGWFAVWVWGVGGAVAETIAYEGVDEIGCRSFVLASISIKLQKA